MNNRLSHYHDPVNKYPRRGILSVPSSSGPMSLPLPGYSGPPVVSGHKPPMGGTKALAHVPPPHWLQTPSRELTGKQGTDRRAGAKWSQHQDKGDSRPAPGDLMSPAERPGARRQSRQLASLSIADVSPRLATQRIMALFQRGDHREAAAFLKRISMATFRQLVTQLPTDVFVDCLPQSLPLLEALYSKLFLSGPGKKLSSALAVSPETVVWQLVKFFARQEDQGLASREGRWELCGPFINTCKRLLSSLITAEPKLIRTVADRKKLLTKVIEGLGQHGMVGSADQSLINLHDGLRQEFLMVREQYQTAIDKLEHLALSSKEPLTNNSGGARAPVLISHQRQLSLSVSQVQERLIKNKTLFTAVEPVISSTSLQVLIGILQRRIELDKEVLFQFNTIKHEAGLVDLQEKNPTIAPTLMKFQRGCHQVLELMKEVTEEEDEEETISDISGYHSDSDSTVMMSGNSPFVSKTARYNFLSRSVRLGSNKSEHRLSLGPGSPAAADSGFSSLPPSTGSPATSSSTSSPPESSSAPDSDSDPAVPDKLTPSDTRRSKIVSRVKTKRLVNTPGWISKVSPPEQGICEKCETKEAARQLLQSEVERLTTDLASSRQTIVRLSDREERLRERMLEMKLCDEQIRISSAGSSVWVSSATDHGGGISSISISPASARLEEERTVAGYVQLYSQARLDTLDALDRMTELRQAEELKSKLLFSIIVLSFRSVHKIVSELKQRVFTILQIPGGSSPGEHVAELQRSVESYLSQCHDNYNMAGICEDVMSQICSTLFDYPSIRQCAQLQTFIRKCVHTAWSLVSQSPAYSIEYEERVYRAGVHVRHHSSDQTSSAVRTYIWPALLRAGQVLSKAVVVT